VGEKTWLKSITNQQGCSSLCHGVLPTRTYRCAVDYLLGSIYVRSLSRISHPSLSLSLSKVIFAFYLRIRMSREVLGPLALATTYCIIRSPSWAGAYIATIRSGNGRIKARGCHHLCYRGMKRMVVIREADLLLRLLRLSCHCYRR
jgi:hypothetical protein